MRFGKRMETLGNVLFYEIYISRIPEQTNKRRYLAFAGSVSFELIYYVIFRLKQTFWYTTNLVEPRKNEKHHTTMCCACGQWKLQTARFCGSRCWCTCTYLFLLNFLFLLFNFPRLKSILFCLWPAISTAAFIICFASI